jgi:hypothetical protein
LPFGCRIICVVAIVVVVVVVIAMAIATIINIVIVIVLSCCSLYKVEHSFPFVAQTLLRVDTLRVYQAQAFVDDARGCLESESQRRAFF